ncbi:DUF5132 domain-containing protein [Chroogloeocystis siderophila]|uniref:DUF5132 domain-containing protein n=1 Tax=Chroogloeocystis siderophila 5.2 s.c.1 TaxID=247279 RepID=A0A1U7I085_9CHRO|nr:DUF5132 domain-containing protein [Chroogloeocystis siderophila]OKH29325.1 hypothetical protein NIES1031_01750 [Chroogloeocystis siderophila 5.2 s.c.1]
MSSQDLEIEATEVIKGLTAVILAPMIFPAATLVSHPLTQSVLKESIILAEKVQEKTAQIEEILDDLVAEARAELVTRREAGTSSENSAFKQNKSGASEYIIDVFTEFNAQVKEMTNGVADLRLLLPLGLSAIALRQLLTKGLQIEEIPWYVLAWYAFDSFTKLNETPTPRSLE